MSKISSIKINRGDISNTQIFDYPMPSIDEMTDGTVLLKLDVFSLSSNNITYAVTGNSLKYWDFFPVDAEHSQLPVWGFGEVVASKHPKFALGDRYYGYYAMSSHILVQPSKVNAYGFVDANPARKCNNPVYDHYSNVKTDVGYKQENEAMLSLFKPLFITSYLLNDFLQENNSYGAEQILITSASSKTAYGLAAILHERKQAGDFNGHIVGLTSSGNVDFVDGLEIYDEIINYTELDKLDTSKRTTIIDFTGNQKMLKQIATSLGDSHAYTSLIGAVQNDRLEDEDDATKHGQFFFAPIQAQKCTQRYGPEKFTKMYSSALVKFIERAKHWIELESLEGAEQIEKKYINILKNSPPPEKGYVASMK